MSQYHPDDPVTARGEAIPLDESVTTSLRQSWPAVILIIVSVVMFFGAGYLWPWFERAAAALSDIAPYVEAVLGQ